MKDDDSSLDDSRRERVRKEALKMLIKTGAIGRFPTPVEDVLSAAKLEVVPEDLANLPFMDRMRNKAVGSLKRALSKLLGVIDIKGGLVFIDHTVKAAKQTFLKLHEVAHSFLIWQRDAYSVIEDCESTLESKTADLFDREANLFATEVLFQLDSFIQETADSPFGIKVPLGLTGKYGASAYAAIRQYVSKNHRACAVVVLNPPESNPAFGFQVTTRRVVVSAPWAEMVGSFSLPESLSPSHPLWALIPMGGKRMSRPRQIAIQNGAGDRFDCVAEAFQTPYNTFILVQAVDTLRTMVVVPGLQLSKKSSTQAHHSR
jgi:hypothetical protein